MTEAATKKDGEVKWHVGAWIGISAISVLWVVYIAILALMISTSHQTPEPGIDPRVLKKLAQGAANMVRVLIPLGLAMAVVTVPSMIALWRKTRRPLTESVSCDG